MKISFPQEDIAILNVYAPNDRSAKYVKEKLVELKEEIEKNHIDSWSLYLSSSNN